MWYYTEDARRDAAMQAEKRAGKPNMPTTRCSSLCADGEPCAITEDGKCDALAEVEALRAEIARLRSALNDVANVPPDTVMTAYLMRKIAKKAIAT